MTPPKIPQPVSADDPRWDLQQRNVEQQIENALFHPTLGDGATLVKTFHDDADIERHMLPADHGKYGLDTHTYRFTVAAQRQFWRWHFANEERIRQARLAEHERKTAEFNRRINERRAKIEAAKPVIELIGEPKMRRRDFGVKVRATVGDGPGPLQHYYFMFRPGELRGQPGHTWSKWRTDFRPHNMPKDELIYTLDPNREYDIAVYGWSPHGGVHSDPVTVAMQGGTAREPTPPPQRPEPTSAPSADPGIEDLIESGGLVDAQSAPHHRFAGTWGNAWGKFPGIAPGRNYGTLEDATFAFPDGSPGLVTALFATDPATLRLTLAPGTAAEQFPDWIVVNQEHLFAEPGRRQTFGLGEARDYRRVSRTGSTSDIHVGRRAEFAIGYTAEG